MKTMQPCLHLFLVTIPILLLDAVRLFLFVLFLLPGFLHFAWFYFVTANRQSVPYNDRSSRQTLDVYSLPEKPLILRPVVVFFPGGAWLIGYKMWGALLAKALNPAGMVVVVGDYRNYPWGTVPAMVEDVQDVIKWTLENIAEHGGDPEKVVVVGQSAGGHLACTAVIRKALQEMCADRNDKDFCVRSICGFISASAPYNLEAMQRTFSKHGMDGNFIERLFAGQTSNYCPYSLVKECQQENKSLQGRLPPIKIYHGNKDKTVPSDGSRQFATLLEKTGVKVQYIVYQEWSHTDPILEGPMDADHSFHKDLFESVKEWTKTPDLVWPAESPQLARMCPHVLLQLGRWCIPF